MIRLLMLSVYSFMKEHGQMLAGSISCFFMLSFIPFFIFLTSILGFVFAGNEAFQSYLLERISDFFPEITADVSEELARLIRQSEVGLFTLLGYLFFSYHLYISLEISVNSIFKIHGTRPVLQSLTNALLVITLLMVVVIVSFGATAALSIVFHFGKVLGIPRIDFLLTVTGFISPPLLVFLTCTALYRFLPRAKVSWNSALKGALFTAISFEAAKYIFTFYISIKLAQFGPFYGSLTGVVVFIFWLLYSASVFLIGAGFVRNLEEARNSHRKKTRNP